MAKNVKKLAQELTDLSMDPVVALKTAHKLADETTKAMFNAIVWGLQVFGLRASCDPQELEIAMDNGRLTEFQAQAKLARQA